MKLALIFTNDWELFGDGSGDFFEIQSRPTLELLKTAEAFGAKITLMAEVYQQWEHKKLSEKYQWAKDVADAWEEIVKNAASNGCDVQLHLHPQWAGAEYVDGKWILNMDASPLSMHAPETIEKMLSDGKNYLEGLIRPVSPDYSCNIFRAGGYCIEPSDIVVRKLRDAGFISDTSVTKGLFSGGFYDFRDAHSNIIPWYTTDSSVKYQGGRERGVLEAPIYSDIGWDSPALKKFFPRLYYTLRFKVMASKEELDWARERETVKNRRYPKENRHYKKVEKKDIIWYMKALLSYNATQLDYDYLPATVFVKALENILKNKNLQRRFKSESDDAIIPVIASGHIKDIHNCKNIERIFHILNKNFRDVVEYWTLSEAVNYWIGNK